MDGRLALKISRTLKLCSTNLEPRVVFWTIAFGSAHVGLVEAEFGIALIPSFGVRAFGDVGF